MTKREDLPIEQELEVVKELQLMQADPQTYLDVMIQKIIQQFKEQSLKPVRERDYDNAFMTLTRILLVMRELIAR